MKNLLIGIAIVLSSLGLTPIAVADDCSDPPSEYAQCQVAHAPERVDALKKKFVKPAVTLQAAVDIVWCHYTTGPDEWHTCIG